LDDPILMLTARFMLEWQAKSLPYKFGFSPI